jgi:hypothetical protein
VKTDFIAVEVETENTLCDAGRQLRGHQKPVYVAPTSDRGVQRALERYDGTSIGVMDQHGNIVQPSSRRSR